MIRILLNSRKTTRPPAKFRKALALRAAKSAMQSRMSERRSAISRAALDANRKVSFVMLLSDMNPVGTIMGSNYERTMRAPRRRDNPNIEMPPDDSIPVPPDQEHGPPVEAPPPDEPDFQPDPPPIREPDSEPTNLVMR